MARYRSKPVEVEAVQFFSYPLPWPKGVQPDPCPCGRYACTCNRSDQTFYVVTIQGHKAPISNGEWVITEPEDGTRHYPCKDKVFRARYEEVSSVAEHEFQSPGVSPDVLEAAKVINDLREQELTINRVLPFDTMTHRPAAFKLAGFVAAQAGRTMIPVSDDGRRQHRVQLSNGRILLVEEGEKSLHLASENEGHPGSPEYYVCTIDSDGILVMTSSGDACDWLTRDLTKTCPLCDLPLKPEDGPFHSACSDKENALIAQGE